MAQGATGYDLAVIGSGGAAFAAAIAARRADRSVVMVDRGTVGGTCVNTGCVPSKALLAAAEARHVALGAAGFPGIRAGADDVVFPELIGGKTDLIQEMRATKYLGLAEQYGWDILAGHARFMPAPALHVELHDGSTARVEAGQFVVATGSAPWTPPIEGIDEVGYLTSTTAMELEALPGSLLVLGGGYVGLEQAQLFARLGCQVTVIARSALASAEEPEISAALAGVFADEDITVHTEATVTRLRRDPDGQVVATLASGNGAASNEVAGEVRGGALLVATGRRPVTDGLDLPAVGVKVGDRGEVVVDAQLRSDNPCIWAAGDVTGAPQFVYVAAAQGALVVDNALHAAGRALDYRALPRVTFTGPAVASVGLTEARAQAQGYDCDCRVLGLDAVPRAVVNRDTRGLVKLVAERGSGRLLGAHVLSTGAGEVIATAVYALHQQMTVHDMAELWCPYLTMTEALKLAAKSFTRDITLLSCCAA